MRPSSLTVTLLNHPVFRTWHRQMTAAWRAFDRSTAYGCAQADRPFDPDAMAHRWAHYQQVTNSVNWNEVVL